MTAVVNGKTTLVGVTSWGYGCANDSYPGLNLLNMFKFISKENLRPCANFYTIFFLLKNILQLFLQF
jgi:hypothetical protein